MKRNAMILGVVLVCAATSALADAKAADDLVKRMQGEWRMVSGEMGGQPLPAKFIDRGIVVSIRDRAWTSTVGAAEPDKFTFTTDESASPATLDRTDPDPEVKPEEKVIVAIVKVDGDTMTLCEARPGNKNRPTEFKSADRSTAVFVYQRKK